VGAQSVADTAILERCPQLTNVLAGFKCPVKSARLLRLAAGSVIREHRDYNLGYEDGEVRLHIPVFTNGDVEFFLEGERLDLKEGECWYLNFNLPHRVVNRGTTDRIHLVLDCVLNDWLQSLILSGASTMQSIAETASDVPPRGGWNEFREAVLNDPTLQARLRVTEDQQSFIKIVIRLGREIGYHFSATEVNEAMNLARRVWIERWVE
jgi:aspartyl/asparaginyl beta-hydroxylase (cupin superfamily)